MKIKLVVTREALKLGNFNEYTKKVVGASSKNYSSDALSNLLVAVKKRKT